MTLEMLDLEEPGIELPQEQFQLVQPIEQMVQQPQAKGEKKKPGFWDKVFNKKKLEKPNRVAVLYLRNNGSAVPMEVESKNGFLNIMGKTYHENRDCIYSMGKSRTPLAIIPEWSLIPIGTKVWDDKDIREKFAECQDHALKGIRYAELVKMGGEKDNKVNTRQVVLLVIGLIIAGAVIWGYM